MDRKFKSFILTPFIFLLIFCSCVPVQSGKDDVVSLPSSAVSEQSTPTRTASMEPLSTPSKTARANINLSGYAITYNEKTCPLKEVEFYDRYVFQADCAEQMLIPQGSAINITFETPDDQPVLIKAVPDLEALFGALEPPFLFCEFGEADAQNGITFGTPFQQTTGLDILCAFSTTLQEKEVVIVLTGLTTRSSFDDQ